MKGNIAVGLVLISLLLVLTFSALCVRQTRAQPPPVFLLDLPAQVYVAPSTVTVFLNEIFNVSIYVSTPANLDLYGWQLWLQWDPSMLNYTASQAFWPNPSDIVNGTTGQLIVGSASAASNIYIGVPSAPPSKVFTVTFQSLSYGISLIDVTRFALMGRSDTGNGWVKGTDPYNGIPEFTQYDRWPDAHADGLIDIYDAIALAKSFYCAAGDTHYNSAVDYNNDNIVDNFDLAILGSDWMKDSTDPTWPNSTYPTGLTNTIYVFNETVQNCSVESVVRPYVDYAPSGMPDFDQKQSNWTNPTVGWIWCGPVAAANSLWWLDSEYESMKNPSPVPPPLISDNFALVQAYGLWDDHDERNVDPLINDLAYLMDTDGIRTHLNHSGTFFNDAEIGISQYLQKHGVNPKGDCDGDGDVDGDDVRIVVAAFGTVPGNLLWNMAADVFADNKIDVKDQILVANNYGKVGMFYEHTEEFPAYTWIEQETNRGQDVELLIEFWQDLGGGLWNRYMNDPGGQGGHYVTVAGFSSTTNQILVSDPWQDAFEAGTAPGESPAPHPYPHPSSLHNNTLFVSHDAYVALPWMIPAPSPYPDKSVWELMGYLQTMGFDPSWHAFIRAAAATSPHGIAIGLVSTLKDLCTPMPTFGQGITYNVSVRVLNEGMTPQSCDVTVYVNSTSMETKTITNLPPNSTTVLNFSWNTGNWTYGDYILSAKANVSYNIFVDYYVSRLVLPGDIDGNGWVDVYDGIRLSNAFNTTPKIPAGESPGMWNSNADINGDAIVDIYDAILLASHCNQHYP